eukprot:Seg851.3 transcript_id=Seg851.3/GoldUCD/mRNA.D3Y31 product="BTB/POZ domain-containing protein KCTD14" protein_id=Seg851.3/GoldUCD/D3Y31
MADQNMEEMFRIDNIEGNDSQSKEWDVEENWDSDVHTREDNALTTGSLGGNSVQESCQGEKEDSSGWPNSYSTCSYSEGASSPQHDLDRVSSLVNWAEVRAEIDINETHAKAMFEEVDLHMNDAYTFLKGDLEIVEDKIRDFKEMKEKLGNAHFDEVIKLNVGGQIFETSLKTLRKYPGSFLAEMFSREHQIIKGADGAFFIDHDGTYFRHILNYLRVGVIPAKVVEQLGQELLPEAEFYGLHNLVDVLRGNTESREGKCDAQNDASLDAMLPNCTKTKDLVSNVFGKISKGYQILRKDLNHFEEIERKAVQIYQTLQKSDEVVKLNVGGIVFQTSHRTLRKEPESMLAMMFSESFDFKQCEDGTYFIDRDGSRFRHVLGYLRDGELSRKVIKVFGEELLIEAAFYGLVQFQNLLKTTMNEIKLEEENVLSNVKNNIIAKIVEEGSQIRAKMESGNVVLKAMNESIDVMEKINTRSITLAKKEMKNHIDEVNSNVLKVLNESFYLKKILDATSTVAKALGEKDDFKTEIQLAVKEAAEDFQNELEQEAKFHNGLRVPICGFKSSEILKEKDQLRKKLDTWLLETRNAGKVSLLYSAVYHGPTANHFHELCDGQAPTLVLIESEFGCIFGGFTSLPWEKGNTIS